MSEPAERREEQREPGAGSGTDREVTLRLAAPEAPRRSRYWRYAIPLAIVAAVALFFIVRAVAPASVTVIKASPTPVTRAITATGQVAGARETQVGADIPGVVGPIFARDGNRVRKGQLLFALQTAVLDAQVNQARQAVQTARAQLAQVQAGPLPQDIQRLRSELAKTREVGLANVRAAEARLRDLEAGARPTEIAQAQAEVRRLRAAESQAQSDLRRTRMLVAQGALSQADLDRAQTAFDTARESRVAAEQQLAQLRAGTRPEQIAQARADLAAARANYITSTQSAEAALRALEAQPRPEDVRVARQRVDEAQAALNAALDQRAKATVYAPFDGIVTQLLVESGQAITPGQPALRLVEIGSPEITVNLDENDLSDVALGQEAVVTSQAYPGRSFTATVSQIAPRIDPEQGTVEVKLVPKSRPYWLRSDMTVDVSIIIASGQRAILLPADAVKKVGGQEYAMVVRNGRAVRRAIVTGGAGPRGIVVLSGVEKGDLVIRNADKVMDGERVTYRRVES